MSDLLVVCEACGAKNSVKPELKPPPSAPVQGPAEEPITSPWKGRMPSSRRRFWRAGFRCWWTSGPVVHALQDDQSHRP